MGDHTRNLTDMGEVGLGGRTCLAPLPLDAYGNVSLG